MMTTAAMTMMMLENVDPTYRVCASGSCGIRRRFTRVLSHSFSQSFTHSFARSRKEMKQEGPTKKNECIFL